MQKLSRACKVTTVAKAGGNAGSRSDYELQSFMKRLCMGQKAEFEASGSAQKKMEVKFLRSVKGHSRIVDTKKNYNGS